MTAVRTPFIVVVAHLEVVGPDLPVSQLTQTPSQLSIPVAVIRGVEELPARSSHIALWHRVAYNTVCKEEHTL